MTIQSLGVGSGLALDSLVEQLITAERQPKEDRLNAKEENIESEISGLGKIKSKLSEFQDIVDELKRDREINGRAPKVTNPTEDSDILSAESANSALRGSYNITVSQLASGSRITTDEGAFSSSSDNLLTSGSGSLTFSVGTDKSFTVSVGADTSLADLRELINDNEDSFGVTANIIETGTSSGPRLVFLSSETGSGNDLVITNDNGTPELDKLSTVGGSNNINPDNIENAKNAVASVDGIEVQSQTNKFENTIQNVTFTAKDLSPKQADGELIASKLTIGFDKEGLEEKIREFVDGYNSLIDELENQSKYGASALEDDGALAGDSMIRGIKAGIASIVGGNVSSSSLGGLFSLGVELNKDGRLEISSTDFGVGSGEDRLENALEENFDDIALLFTDENEGIANQLLTYLDQYTSSSGLLNAREKSAKEERERVYDARESLELRMISYESLLRDRYLNLDQTVAQLNQTGAALFSIL